MTVEPRAADQIAIARQQRLIELLACPRCSTSIEPTDATLVDGAVVDAELACPSCGVVGVVRTYRPSFHPEDLGDAWVPAGMAEAPIDLTGAAVGDAWGDLDGGLLSTAIGQCLTGITTAESLLFELDSHPWGGAAVVTLGDVEQRVELCSASRQRHRIILSGGGDGSRRWSITNVPSTDRDSHGAQVLAIRVSQLVPAVNAPPLRFVAVNKGNPYPGRLQEILDELPPDAVAVDIGGGDRCHPDPRLLNFEYLKFDHADFFGDGLHLPIASESVDFVHSQAVLEHVPDPQRAVDELRRIVKPGGRIYAEFAFMQPLHAVPFHFFNITPHGAALLFDDWETIDTGVFGGLKPTIEWFFGVIGADSKIGDDERRAVLDTLERLDAKLSRAELEHVASAVYVEARKPR